MKKETISRITLALILFTSAALSARAIEAATELARVNNEVITLQDFDKHYKQSLQFFQFNAPTKKNALEEQIKRTIGVQEAKKMGLDRDPLVVEQMKTVLYQAYLNKSLAKQFDAIHVTDSEAKDFYSKNPEIRVSHIFVAVRPDAKKADIDDAMKRIQDLHKKVNGANFAEMAQKFSEGAVAQAGGDIGWQTRGQLDPALYDAAKNLGVGSVSGVVKSQFGYHLVKLTGKKAWDEVDQAGVKRMAIDERRQQIYDSFTHQMREKAHVVVHAELLKD